MTGEAMAIEHSAQARAVMISGNRVGKLLLILGTLLGMLRCASRSSSLNSAEDVAQLRGTDHDTGSGTYEHGMVLQATSLLEELLNVLHRSCTPRRDVSRVSMTRGTHLEVRCLGPKQA